MSGKMRVPALANQVYRVGEDFPCALYDGESDCAGMTDQKNYCHGCKSYVCQQCDQVDVAGPHEAADHKRRNG